MSFSLPKAEASYLDGQLLIAMPSMRDPRFARSVVYVCAHSAEGAMGIGVNQLAKKVKFPELLVQLEVVEESQAIRLPARAEGVAVLRGGPVETGRGFVLHTSDYAGDTSTLEIDGSICLTATVDILRAIARDEGPDHAVLALGYAAWSAGQLESELQDNGWLHCPADPSFLFGAGIETRYERALAKLGVDPARLSSAAGHA